jgi:predicted ATPase
VKRFILTGAPGAGKTAILRQLELDGFGIVEEAATNVIALAQARGIAEPWKHDWFIDSVVDLQRLRLDRALSQADAIQFHDRSVICTVALATYLEHPLSDALTGEVERVLSQGVYQKTVFFVRNLGYIEPTAVRRISFEETLRFERIHEETYRRFGFEIMFVAPGSVSERVAAIKTALERLGVQL